MFSKLKTALYLVVTTFGGVSMALAGCATQTSELVDGEHVGVANQALTTCVTIRDGNGNVDDARLSKNAKNTNFGNNPVLQVGEDDHTLIRFDLSSIPSSAVINSAVLKVYAHGQGQGNGCDDDDDDDDNGRIRIHRAKVAWSENSVTYKNFNNQYDNAVAGTLVSHNHTALQSASVKGLVTQWVSGAKPNHGFLLENKDGDDHKTNFASGENNNAALRPALEVCYTTPDDNHCDPNPCVHGACSNQQNGYSCACDVGWSGANCDVNIDDCVGAPCQNGGTCTDQANGYACACPAGYTGANCEIDIDECASQPCVNGDCSDLVNGYSCACNPGFSGTNCETNIDDCVGAPCQNGGTCTDQTNGYTCACPAGYTGGNCEIDIDECASQPCVNGMCVDEVNGFSCVCHPGFSGTLCETNTDECAGQPCQNGGTCTDGIFSYSCACPAGYTGDNCEIDIDECASQPCVNGDCTDLVNGYTCGCAPGWTGTNCEIDIDECASNPCVNGQCNDQINGYSCACDPGWTGTNCENQAPVTCPCHDDEGWQNTLNNGCSYEIDEGWIYFGTLDGSLNGHLNYAGCAAGDAGQRPLTPEQFNVCLTELRGVCGSIDPCEVSYCSPVGGTCVVNEDFTTSCQCFEGYSGRNCSNPPPVTCPCAQFADWLPTSYTACSYDPSYDNGGAVVLGFPGDYGTLTGGSATLGAGDGNCRTPTVILENIGAAEVAACNAQLKAWDDAHLGLCSSCWGDTPYCVTSCFNFGDGLSCY
jgi:hypothetical protein